MITHLYKVVCFFFLQGNFYFIFGDFLFCCPKQVSLFNAMTVLKQKIYFPCPVDKMVNTSFRLNAANKAYFCCSVRLGKALIKYRGQNFFEYSFRNNIHGVPLRALVPCKCYCECSIQTIFFPSRERQNEV